MLEYEATAHPSTNWHISFIAIKDNTDPLTQHDIARHACYRKSCTLKQICYYFNNKEDRLNVSKNGQIAYEVLQSMALFMLYNEKFELNCM